ncbi:hypothetical protein [Aeromonas salmonicida]|uniref:hypothetical protein n=1 Tax=Aeromonas salmonicida TaxID=645 RepID=UPI003D1EA141
MKALFVFMLIMTDAAYAASVEDFLTDKERLSLADISKGGQTSALQQSVAELNHNKYLLDALSEEGALKLSLMAVDLRGLSNKLVDVVIDGGGDSKSVLFAIGKLSRDINNLKNDKLTRALEIAELETRLNQQSKILALRQQQQRKKLVALRNDIVRRLQSSDNVMKTFTYDGSFQCSTQKSIRQCIDAPGRRNAIIDAALSPQGDDMWQVVGTPNYKVNSANMDLDGTISYQVEISYKETLNKQAFRQINEALGLQSFDVTLSSNESVTYFIDGKVIGVGKKISANVDAGSHAISVKSKSGRASIIKEIANDDTLYIPVKVYSLSKNQRSEQPKIIPLVSPDESVPLSLRPEPASPRLTPRHLEANGVKYFIPLIKNEGEGYLDQGNSFTLMTYNEAALFCKGETASQIASQLDYSTILKSSGFSNDVGFKSSFWLNESTVITRMGDGVLARRVNSKDRYNVICTSLLN